MFQWGHAHPASYTGLLEGPKRSYPLTVKPSAHFPDSIQAILKVLLAGGVLASLLLQNPIIVSLLLLLNGRYHVRTLGISIQLLLKLFIEVFDKILVRLFQGAWNHARVIISLRCLRMKCERFYLFELLSYEVWLRTDQGSRNLVIEHLEAELRSLGHLEFLIILTKFDFFPLPGLNSIRNNFHHSVVLFFLLNSP